MNETLDSIIRDKEGLSQIRKLGREEILKKGGEIKKQMLEMYEALKGENIHYHFKVKCNRFSSLPLWLWTENDNFQAHMGEEAKLFSFVIKKEKKCYAGTGDSFYNLCRSEGVIIPKRRSYNTTKDEKLTSIRFVASGLVSADDFFKELTKHYDKHYERVNEILNNMINFPNYIANHLKEIKMSTLESITQLQENKKGIKLFRKANDKIREKQTILTLYKVKPEIFKAYFESIPQKQKLKICEEILGLKNPNKEVDAWIGQNYPKLIETAGRDRTIKLIEKEGIDNIGGAGCN